MYGWIGQGNEDLVFTRICSAWIVVTDEGMSWKSEQSKMRTRCEVSGRTNPEQGVFWHNTWLEHKINLAGRHLINNGKLEIDQINPLSFHVEYSGPSCLVDCIICSYSLSHLIYCFFFIPFIFVGFPCYTNHRFIIIIPIMNSSSWFLIGFTISCVLQLIGIWFTWCIWKWIVMRISLAKSTAPTTLLVYDNKSHFLRRNHAWKFSFYIPCPLNYPAVYITTIPTHVRPWWSPTI